MRPRVDVMPLSDGQQELLLMAVSGLSLALGGRVIGAVCCDETGDVWIAPLCDEEARLMRYLATADWQTMARLAEEFIP